MIRSKISKDRPRAPVADGGAHLHPPRAHVYYRAALPNPARPFTAGTLRTRRHLLGGDTPRGPAEPRRAPRPRPRRRRAEDETLARAIDDAGRAQLCLSAAQAVRVAARAADPCGALAHRAGDRHRHVRQTYIMNTIMAAPRGALAHRACDRHRHVRQKLT